MKKENYHDRAQTFIKSAKSKGMKVTAEGEELIATPPAKKFVPTYGGKVGGKMSDGSGWGGESVASARKLAKGRSNIRITN